MIILASKSPRREEICKIIGLEFEIIPAKSECDIDLTVSPEEAIKKVYALQLNVNLKFY